MTKFHINDKGEAGQCKAHQGNCPFGGESEHYSTADDARKAYEKFQEGGSWGTVVKDSKLELMRATRGSFFVKEGKVFEVERNGTRGANMDVALSELTPDGFRGKTEYITGPEDDTSGYRPVTLEGALQELASQNVESRAAQALREGRQVNTFKELSMEGEKLDFATVKPMELYTNSNNANGNAVYLVTNISRNASDVVVGAELKEVSPGDFDGYPVYVDNESPIHINKDTFRKLSPEESARFKQLRKDLGDDDWDEVLASQKFYAQERLRDAEEALPEATKRFINGDYSEEVSNRFQDHASAIHALARVHSIENPDDTRGRLEYERDELKAWAKTREVQYKDETKGVNVFKKLDSGNVYKRNLDLVVDQLATVEARLRALDSSGKES